MKKKSKKASQKATSGKRRFLRCLLLTTIIAVLLTMTVLAADADTIRILKKFDMPQNNVVSYVCRWIGWAMLCGLSYLVNGIESVIYNVNGTIGNFFANATTAPSATFLPMPRSRTSTIPFSPFYSCSCCW